MNKLRHTMFMVTIFLILALSLFSVAPALADDELPPPPDSAEPALPPEPAASSSEAPGAQGTSESAGLADVPEGTDVVVVSGEGEVLPLASQEAVEVIAAADPMWCPAGVTPVASTGGCSASFGNLQTLVSTFTPPAGNGVIWIEDGSYISSGNITIDGGTWVAASTFNLTLKGGWTGAGTTIDQSNPSIINGDSLSVVFWNGNLSFSDIRVNGAATNTNGVAGLYVSTSKNITLDRVQSSSTVAASGLDGAILDTGSGTSGNVTVNDGVFVGNDVFGLEIYATGTVMTKNIYAENNGSAGALIDNTYSLMDKAVTLKGVQQFNDNGWRGLGVFSNGLVTLSNLVANRNSDVGVYVDNTASAGNLGVTITGTNSFASNSAGGLSVKSHGAITVGNLNASTNGAVGVVLDNCDYDGMFSWCLAPVMKPVKVGGVNVINGNGASGLSIVSFGAISVNNLTASSNTVNGSVLYNAYTNLSSAVSTGSITLTGYVTTWSNLVIGLVITSYGNISAQNLDASYNSDSGADLYTYNPSSSAVSNIKLSGTNVFNGNLHHGLVTFSDGSVSVNNGTFNFNTDSGAYIYNYGVGKAVTFTGPSFAIGNGDAGLDMESAGAITLTSVTANENGSYGADLNNSDDPATPYAITIKGTNSFNGNAFDGLSAVSFGSITVNNLTASGNGATSIAGSGAQLDNCNLGLGCTTIVPKSVTITGYVRVNDNYTRGLDIDSLGAITVSNITANANGSAGGVYLYNAHNSAVMQNIAIKGTNTVSDNAKDGLMAYSYGNVTVNNLTADRNFGGWGALFDTYNGGTYTAPRNVTLTGVNSFSDNFYDGLWVDVSGSASISRVTADRNDGYINAYNGAGVHVMAVGNITLTCAHMVSNEAEGYYLTSSAGTVTIKGFYTFGNGSLNLISAPAVIVHNCTVP